MKLKVASVALPAVLLAAAVAALSLARGGSPREPRPSPRPASPPVAALREPEPVDVATLRDVFRFADEQPRQAVLNSGPVRLSPPPTVAPAPAGPRLVGILRRSGRLVAALVSEGEVELAGPGESAAGVTVIAVREDGVTIRRPDGSETTLLLPD